MNSAHKISASLLVSLLIYELAFQPSVYADIEKLNTTISQLGKPQDKPNKGKRLFIK